MYDGLDTLIKIKFICRSNHCYFISSKGRENDRKNIVALLNKKQLFFIFYVCLIFMPKTHIARWKEVYTLVTAILLVSILSWFLGLTTYLRTSAAKAASFVEATNIVTDTDLSVTADHTFYFKLASAMANSATIDILLNSNYTTSTAVVIDDIDVATSTSRTGTFTDVNVGTTCTAAFQFLVTVIGNSNGSGVRLQNCSSSVLTAANTVLKVEIGANATAQATGSSKYANPSAAGAYRHTVTLLTLPSGGTITDQSEFMTVAIDDVDVSASVSSTFSFGLAGVASGSTTCANDGTSSDITTTSTTIPWGVLSPGSAKVACQAMTVATNASNGFLVSVARDGNLANNTGADIDIFKDGTAQGDTPVVWTSPTATVTNENTWGHMGVASSDATLNSDLTGATSCDGSTDSYSTNLYTNIGVTSTPTLVFCHTGPANADTPNTGFSNVSYKIETSALQEAGLYRQNLTFVATPIF